MAAHFGAAFSFAHFINADGGAEITRAYAREFKPSPWRATPQASVAVFVVCADTHEEAERLAKSRDLFVARIYTGRGGRYPTVAEAEAHEYTAWERQIVEHARGRRVAGTPVECRERLEAIATDYGVDEIVVVTITETAETRRRSYELLADAFELRPR
jgi:alkanesulfonate monooxygenase SsuD/methylene tetrahydromethanopterin reductase-like flavin-dependent oxidoreductase (luciferase family)